LSVWLRQFSLQFSSPVLAAVQFASSRCSSVRQFSLQFSAPVLAAVQCAGSRCSSVRSCSPLYDYWGTSQYVPHSKTVLYPGNDQRITIRHTSKKQRSLTNVSQLTSTSRALLEKLTVAKLIKKLPTLYCTRRFNTVLEQLTVVLCLETVQSNTHLHTTRIYLRFI
jgi:hypothetical protein